ncbi:lipopolysaccharide biosynthesis protein [Aliarcobacter butzleri]|uniref:lipopolysaccharide biosynthesis protein n=1 Tax=Aliarcobacter butzleri TaxID=28197 RepID=UPI003AF4D2F3
MINKLKPKSEFSKNVLTLMTGTTIAQAIPIAITPILTRMYTPNDFGVFALFVAVTAVLGSISNGRYELSIMLPKKDEDAINIFALGFIITCFVSFLLLILVIIFNDYFTRLLGNDEISFWLYFMPISVFFIGLFNLLNYFNNRRKNYKDLRNAIIFKSIILVITQLSIGFIKQGAMGLISGEILSRMASNSKLLKNIVKDKILISKISKIKIIALGKRYKDFPKYNILSTTADVLTLQLPFLMIPKIFNLSISGFFFFSQKIISLPASLISKSISQVLFQKMTENKNKNLENMDLLLKTIKKLLIISLFISINIIIFGQDLFEIIFGDNWKLSGIILQYLAVIFIITFVVSTVSVAFSVTMELKKLAFWQYLYLISSMIFFTFFLYYDFTIKEFLFFYVIHEYIHYTIYLVLILLSVKKMDKEIILKGK